MKSKFIALIAVIILFVVGLGYFMNKAASAPSKYDDFAKALKTDGAEFFGAFWCPHCQAEKALFGSSKQFLPYVECSKADKSQTQICIDNKVENYPTWKFKGGISLTSKEKPTVCDIRPGKPDEPTICAQIASQFFKTWYFPEYSFSLKSPTDPTEKNGFWQFSSETLATGEIPLEFLAQQIGFALPASDSK